MDVHHLPGYPTTSSSTVHFRPELPTELWTRIFRLATGDPVHISTTYIPFANHSAPFIDSNQLRIKAAIILVCRRWRALGLHFFYQEIRIPNRPAIPVDGLLEGLQRVERFETEPNGRHVRRVILSSTRVDYDLAVLKCCPSVEVVIKPTPQTGHDASRILHFPFPDPSISLFNFLRRIEWSFQNTYGVNEYHTQESLRILWHIIHLTPNLHYLSVSGETPWALAHHRNIFSDLCEQVHSLRVLRTHRLTGGLLEGVSNWCLPNLTHHTTDSTLLLETIQAPHVRVVELLNRPAWLVSGEIIRRTLTSFLRLEELSYILEDVHWPPLSQIAGTIPPNLRCVRLHGRSSSLDAVLVNRHLQWLYDLTIPSLKQVILYGDGKQNVVPLLIRIWIPRFEARQCSLRLVNKGKVLGSEHWPDL